MKSIAYAIAYIMACVLRFLTMCIIVPIYVVLVIRTEYLDWKDSLPRGERSDPPRGERDDGTEDDQ